MIKVNILPNITKFRWVDFEKSPSVYQCFFCHHVCLSNLKLALSHELLLTAQNINWKIFVVKLLQIHTRGRSFRFNWNWIRFVFLRNEIEVIMLIEFDWSDYEFGNWTHRKVPGQLCSITEPIEQQSDRLGLNECDWVLVQFTPIDYSGFIQRGLGEAGDRTGILYLRCSADVTNLGLNYFCDAGYSHQYPSISEVLAECR